MQREKLSNIFACVQFVTHMQPTVSCNVNLTNHAYSTVHYRLHLNCHITLQHKDLKLSGSGLDVLFFSCKNDFLLNLQNIIQKPLILGKAGLHMLLLSCVLVLFFESRLLDCRFMCFLSC